ncbi:MAG: cellulose synthase [Ferruginibacter sp.]|nr:cellulose synthase [Ferruginibacter sp.]
MKNNITISPPTRGERFTLRLIILLGITAMFFFLRYLLSPSHFEASVVYWLLLITIIFSCLKVLHEWIHYFSISIPETPVAEKIYTVDIFTTHCAGEPIPMLERTLKAILAISYPHETYLCDESADPYLQEFCERLGIHYVTRTDKKDAKAGNINNALQLSHGELCVVLDPDHEPTPEFLNPIVPHFNDPKIGFVQIVQAYSNYGENLIAKGAAQQTFQFYGPMMMSMNSYGTVPAIGANCTFRRTALESIGGHAAGLAEDLHTAMQLHAKGWESVYVPKILARGLVPSTLHAYYQQQLKWSRGVFELFATSYLRLFKKFTWQQKLHYGTILVYYLSGLIYLINFLIPIIAVLFNASPARLDFYEFAALGFPLVSAIVFIRHYVQWWVMEEEERGFHVVGGLLMMGTWWVFLKGLIYTIAGKKVAYLPTPKDARNAKPGILNLPNVLVLLLSLFAIIYGLITDWNPYNIVMAGFAFLNCCIMAFTIMASKQLQFRKFKDDNRAVSVPMSFVSEFKRRFWLVRHRIYLGLRSTATFLTICALFASLFLLRYNTAAKIPDAPQQKKDIFLNGIFAPGSDNGLTSLDSLQHYKAGYHYHPQLVSLYLAWGDLPANKWPVSLIDSIYQSGAIPLLTWEPWPTSFQSKDNSQNNILKEIRAGRYDSFLVSFCRQLQLSDRPLFLRFAHEPGNPAYPWTSNDEHAGTDYIAAWRYVHDFFAKEQLFNITWIFNPWKAEDTDRYYPGDDYVDWLGVNILDYNKERSGSFKDLYRHFHQQPVFRAGLPVIVTEMGTLQTGAQQQRWLSSALDSMRLWFPEIKGAVLFNSAFDQNNLPGDTGMLKWTATNPASVFKAFTDLSKASGQLLPLRAAAFQTGLDNPGHRAAGLPKQFFKGTYYARGEHWQGNIVPFTREELRKDFKDMKAVGISTVKHVGPGVYDYNVLRAAKEFSLGIQYAFVFPAMDYVLDNKEKERQIAIVRKTVRQLKGHAVITSWHLATTAIQDIDEMYYPPFGRQQKQACALWLNDVVKAIVEEDANRPVTLDVMAGKTMAATASLIKNSMPGLSGVGIIIPHPLSPLMDAAGPGIPWFYSSVNAKAAYSLSAGDHPFFLESWKDEAAAGNMKWNGLKDANGNDKPGFTLLKNKWESTNIPLALPLLRILKPAETTWPGAKLTYYAVTKQNGRWMPGENPSADIRYEWFLIEYDRYQKAVDINSVGKGSSVALTIPDHPERFKLQLVCTNTREHQVLQLETILNTPLGQ